MRKALSTRGAFLYPLSGQADHSSRPDSLVITIRSRRMLGLPAYPWWCRSSCFGAVPITLLAIFKVPHHLAQSFPGASRHGFWLRALLPDEKAESVAREAQSPCFCPGRGLVMEAGRRLSSGRGYSQGRGRRDS